MVVSVNLFFSYKKLHNKKKKTVKKKGFENRVSQIIDYNYCRDENEHTHISYTYVYGHGIIRACVIYS